MKHSNEEIEKKLYSRNYTNFGLDMNLVVSLGSGFIILLFTAYAFIDLESANILFNSINAYISSNFDWVFILSSTFFILVTVIIGLSRLGNVRIGGIDAETEFSNFAWYSMLISAGMGIGLMFWSVGEPLTHFVTTPPIFESNNPEAQALAATFFHWGIHPWAVYSVIALALAFYAYNRNLPLALRSVFYPILKDRVFGIWGDLIDILAVVACLFGLATSLGLGAQQINSGLNYVFGINYSVNIQILLIIIITAIATLSVFTGIDKGVQILSKLNIRVAFCFMVFIFILGPSLEIVKLFSSALGVYLGDFIKNSFYLGERGEVWQSQWTVFYLAWWISWSPFVGMFIARISKGRTIREFVLAVLVVPSLVSFVWLSIFGGTAIAVNNATDGQLMNTVNNNVSVALFEMIRLMNIPILKGLITVLLSAIGTFLIISFFVTSSDSGSIVVDNLTSGKTDAPVKQRIFWACMQGLVAAVLLVIGGEAALETLQTAVIATGLPFSFLMIVMSLLLLNSVMQAYKRQKNIRDRHRFGAFMNQYQKNKRK